MVGLKRFFLCRAYEYMVYAWIACVRYCMAGATLDDAVRTFRKRFNVPESMLKNSAAIKIWQKLDRYYDQLNSDELAVGEIKGDQRLLTKEERKKNDNANKGV